MKRSVLTQLVEAAEMDAIIIVMGVVTIAIQDVQVRVQIPAKMDVQIHVVIAREAVPITVLPVTVVVRVVV